MIGSSFTADLNTRLPIGDVVALVDPLTVRAHLDIGDCMEPFVFEAQFDEIAGRLGWLSFAATGVTTPRAGEDIRIAVVEILVVAEEVVNDELLFLDVAALFAFRGRASAGREWGCARGGTSRGEAPRGNRNRCPACRR